MNAASAKRDARAKAEGFTSYSQKYRAHKAGWSGSGVQYNAALNARRLGQVQAVRATGKLQGFAKTRAGKVIAALFLNQASAQWQQIRAHVDRRRATLTIDGFLHGKTVQLGSHGGYRVGYLKGLVRSEGTWAAAVLYLLAEQYPEAESWEVDDMDGLTVTAVVS